MIHIYHPNRAVKGFACSFWFSERDGSFYATIIKQSGWDDKTQTGSFKGSLEDPSKKINIKLSKFEVAAILDCIERNRPFSTFHSFDESPKSISFVPWMVSTKDEDDKPQPATQKGFSFSIVVNNKADASNKNSFYIGLKFEEARLVREFLIFSLHRSFGQRVNEAKAKTVEEPDPEDESPNNSGSEESNSLLNF